MADSKSKELDSETILITLDQIGQTIDIMTNVVGRLRGYITDHSEQLQQLELPVDTEPAVDSELPVPSPYLDLPNTLH